MPLLGESMGMVSDSVANASTLPSVPISKDFAKKKRANRSAKLKQCKLDARREQWLSQVKKKEGKEAWDGCHEPRNESYCSMGNVNMTRMADEEHCGPFNRERDLEFRANSPASFNGALGKHESRSNYGGSSTSYSSSAGCCSGSITEEEDGDDECLDDWEAVADALAANENRKTPPFGPSPEEEPICRSESCGVIPNESERSTCEGLTMGSKFAPVNSRAWRPDDAFRPQSLPNLLKQRCCSNPKRRHGDGDVPWFCPGVLTVPTSCPICYEDLDLTDSSFLPCFCGFRLCLFCHKRILEADSRCPGCRRPYEQDPAKAEESLQGGLRTTPWTHFYNNAKLTRSVLL